LDTTCAQGAERGLPAQLPLQYMAHERPCAVITLLLRSYCAVITQSLRYYCAVFAQLLRGPPLMS